MSTESIEDLAVRLYNTAPEEADADPCGFAVRCATVYGRAALGESELHRARLDERLACEAAVASVIPSTASAERVLADAAARIHARGTS